uniref:Selenoprotein T n=1 Tax=Odontella aurita TaxID=265563 RepID=A0A7S4NAL4_9STRA|mmetsp:Transcript_5595/g.16219  ORF Transcript_5595/g.16219 Transcript_5595/m.16219 type:complete len:142 (+) Transcript_5595:251-676(+)
MARNFQEVKKFLENEFPELRGHVTGENYPVPPVAAIAVNIVSALQILCMGALLMGDSVWNYIPFVQSPPNWYYAAKENSMVFLIGLFLIVPTMVQKYVTTGAFELILDGNIMFSKIELGRFPNGNDIIGIMTKAGLQQASG